MNLSLETLKKHLPRLNEKIYGETDFYRLCRREKIKVYELPLQETIFGYYSNYRGKAYIILNSRLDKTKRLEVGYHELGHHLLHAPVPESVFFDSQRLSNKQETEAQAFALLALVPATLLKQIEESPSLLDDYPADLIGQRLKLWQDCGI